MIELKLNAPVKDVDGNDIPGTNLAHLLAEGLLSGNSGPALKFLDWAISLRSKGELTLDRTDFDILKNYVENGTIWKNIAKARILEALLKASA